MRSVHPSAENDLPAMLRRSTTTITSGVLSTIRSGEAIITPRMKRVVRRTCPSHSARVIVQSVVLLEPSSICADYRAMASARVSRSTVTLISPGNVISASMRFAIASAIWKAAVSSAFFALRITRISRPA